MSSRIIRTFARATPRTTLSISLRSRAFAPTFSRSYATEDGAVPGQSSNVSAPNASSKESQDINKSAGVGRTDKNNADHASLQNPVSHPEESGVGAQEEPTESQDHMKHDPNESDQAKREKTLGYGQNKPLDAADK